jgi:hypothetical protein
MQARAIADMQKGQTTENTLAYQQMRNNLAQVDLQRQEQFRMYNQSNGMTQGNAQRIGGSTGNVLGQLGGVISEYSNLDSTMGFLADSIIGGIGYNMAIKDGYEGFSGENKQLKIQRAMDQAVQEKFMKSTIKSGNEALESINKQSGVLAGELTDTAIDNTDKYYAVQSAIDDSGVEGSGNMERNLDYMKSRDNAANQLRYDMVRGQAEGVGRGMASSFDQLVQNQEQATLSTLINPVQFDMAGAMDASRKLFMNQPTPQDYDMAMFSAFKK